MENGGRGQRDVYRTLTGASGNVVVLWTKGEREREGEGKRGVTVREGYTYKTHSNAAITKPT